MGSFKSVFNPSLFVLCGDDFMQTLTGKEVSQLFLSLPTELYTCH